METPHFLTVLKKSLVLVLLAAGLAVSRAADPERSVIQILTFEQQPVWDAPWRFDPVRALGGSGFVIKGKRIMTNAHVVSWGRQIIVRRYQDPRPYVAEVEYVGHDCDLAVLTVADDRFFENLQPLELGDLPKVRSTVVTYGYPAGGDEISYTRGVVSRIDLETYAHIGNRRLLSAETDAAINPGNSGGPVVQDDKVVGVAFQGMPGLQNAGFFIPPPVIEHFLKDIEDKQYDGFPQAGLRVTALQNPTYRAFLKLPDNNQGARIDGILQIPSTEQVIQDDDVLLRVGQFPIASDGTILYQGNRVSAALAFQFAQNGQSVPVELWRDGAAKEVSLPLFVYNKDRAAGYEYDTLPRYFVYGGLVFTPLSLDYLRTLGRGPTEGAFGEGYYELFYRRFETPGKARPEPIVLASVLADAVNANVTVRGRVLVDRINGVRIDKLEDVVRAFETNTNTTDIIEFLPHESFECLERADVAKANPRILQTYGIGRDRRL
ncbi:MAG TPA: trypsin-like peptidase domain-containing protein [Verrucomicrobiae bacterium]|nr:trypsin-like peptidase domain-containing protein [Verrucomicrobiae bacterium]